MSQIIKIQDINSSDTIKTMVEKINYNFDQIMTFGGGPQGEKGDKGELGPDGEQGERGNLITVVDDISTVGSDLKVGDIAIYSDDQYIYEVKENSDNNLFFEKTSIYIKGNDGERGQSGTSDSPFKYDEIQDAIVTVTVDDNGRIPSHTFIGTNTVISNGVGALNVVGNGNANGIYLFTGDNDSDYCGKIYGDKLDSKNILVLQGEDNTDNNYVKIDNTLLTDKIHSSDNGIKIAEVTNDRNEIVLGDVCKNTSIKSKNALIDCNKFTVKNGNNTPIETSSPNIILRGNLYVNNNDYSYTTAIYGSSINIKTYDSDVSTYIQANKNNGIILSHVDSRSCVSTCVKTNTTDGIIIEHAKAYNGSSSISISRDNGIKIDTNKTIIGRDIYSHTQINGVATAKVAGVPDVYLGCPIGTIVMWTGREDNLPYGWELCAGQNIMFYESGERLSHKFYYNGHEVYLGTQYQKFENLIYEITGNNLNQWPYEYYFPGSWKGIQLPNFQQKFPLGAKDDTSWVCGQQTYNTSLGSTGGEKSHNLTIDEMPRHSHEMWQFKTNTSTAGGRIVALNANKGDSSKLEPMSESSNTEDEGKSYPHNNMPPFLAINFIIKYK